MFNQRKQPVYNVSVDLTSVPVEWQLNPSKGLNGVHEFDREADGRMTDHTTEK